MAHLSDSDENEPPGGNRRWGVLVVSVAVGLVLVVGAGASVVLPLMTNRASARVELPTTSATPSPAASSGAQGTSLKAALKKRVLFVHDAVGADITGAFAEAYRNAQLPEPQVAPWSQVMRTKSPVFADAGAGRDGDTHAKLGTFAQLVNDAPQGSIDVALMDFSSADISADTDVAQVFNQYVATMDSLEGAHPGITFVYTTVPVTTENSWKQMDAGAVTGLLGATQPMWQSNIARERYNALVRQRYESSGKLFDIAALQARIKGNKVAAKQHESQTFYVMYPGIASSNGRRLNATGSVRLATELAQLIETVTRG